MVVYIFSLSLSRSFFLLNFSADSSQRLHLGENKTSFFIKMNCLGKFVFRTGSDSVFATVLAGHMLLQDTHSSPCKRVHRQAAD